MEKVKTIKQILLQNGYKVTNKKFGGWDNCNRMITDLKDNEIGFYRPLKAIKELCKRKTNKL